MNVLVYKNAKQWFFTGQKGPCILRIGEEEIHITIDCTKEMIVDDMYVFVFEEERGFGIYRKYALPHQLILSKNAYATIQCQRLNQDIIINLEEKSISKNSQLFVNHQHSEYYQWGDLITVLSVRMLITDQFIMINHPKIIQVHLPLKHKFIYANYCLPRLCMPKNERRITSSLPVFEIAFRQFDKVHPYEKPSTFIMILPMLMMACASFAVGVHGCYKAYQQGKSGFDLVVPLLLPSTMILSTLLVKPMHQWLEKSKHKKKLRVRHKMIETYFKELYAKFSEFEKQFDEDQKKCLLGTDEQSLKIYDKTALYSALDDANMKLVVGRGIIKTPVHFTQQPTLEDSDYYHQFIEFQEQTKFLNDKVYTSQLVEGSTFLIHHELMFEWILLQIVYMGNKEKMDIYLFTNDAWLVGRKEYLFMNIHLVIAEPMEFVSTTKKTIAFVVDQTYFQQSHSFTSVFFYKESRGCCEMTITCKENNIIVNDQHVLQPCITKRQIAELKNWLCRQADHKTIKQRSMKLFDITEYEINESNLINQWQINTAKQGLAAPIGYYGEQRFYLDFSERGHGPHILIGATTGAGKSEAMITILYSFMIRYSPTYFQFALVDFKGGGLADVFQADDVFVPHCVGSLTNLDDQEMERLMVSFDNESKRRQLLFSKMVRISKQSPMNIQTYQCLVEQGIQLPQMAHLIYVIDEFAELKDIYPSFINELVRLARTGRSLGIHLLLSTQKPGSVVDAQIWANCNSRICLKVQDKQDSMEMIGSDRAAFLKKPGQFYLFNQQVISEGFFALTSTTYSVEKRMATCVLSSSFTKCSHATDSGDSQIKTLLECMTKQTLKTPQLWQKSLVTLPEESFYLAKNQIGYVDDIQKNQQYPLEYHFQKNMIVYALNQLEKKIFVNNLKELSVHDTQQQRVILIIDFDQLIPWNEVQSKNLWIIRSRNAAISLVNSLRRCTLAVEHLLIVTHFPSFLDALNENYAVVEELLYSKSNNKCTFIFITNTINSVKYSLLSYFPIKVGLSIQEVGDYNTLFEASIKRCCGEKGFGYIKEDEVKLFRFIKLHFKHNNEVQKPLKPIRWFDDEVIIKREHKIVLGIDTSTMDDVIYTGGEIVFIFSKYPKTYQAYIDKTFRGTQVSAMKLIIIDLEGVDDANAIQTIQANKENSIVLGCSYQRWKGSEVKMFFQGTNAIWIGEGFHEQTVIQNDHWIKLAANEAFYSSEERNSKLRCIDRYEE